jgi:hypothetical protein
MNDLIIVLSLILLFISYGFIYWYGWGAGYKEGLSKRSLIEVLRLYREIWEKEKNERI